MKLLDDRRKDKRYEMLLKLNYSGPLAKTRSESITKNISRNGLRFPVDTKFPKGTKLNIEIEDPNSNKLIPAKAIVAWLEEFISEKEPERARYEVGVKLLNKRLY